MLQYLYINSVWRSQIHCALGSIMKHTLLKFAAIGLMVTSLNAATSSTALAQAPSKGVIGGTTETVAPIEAASDVLVEAPSTVPPVFNPAAAGTQPAPAPLDPGAPTAAPAVADPCEAYVGNYSSYTICQDRIMKYQRMKDAKVKRTESQASQAQKIIDDRNARQEAIAAAAAEKEAKKNKKPAPDQASVDATAAAIAAAVAAAKEAALSSKDTATTPAAPTTAK